MARAGLFITFEGGEGTGKSTQIGELANRLRAVGLNIVTTREPGGTPGAEEIRDLVVKGEGDRWSPATELLLFTAARRDHLERIILPALDAGKIVLCDRYITSTIAYQGMARGLGAAYVKAVSGLALPSGWQADLNLILDLGGAGAGLSRAAARSDDETRFEQMGKDFHDTLAASFRTIAAEDPAHHTLIDATGSIAEVSARVWAAAEPALKAKGLL